MADKDKVVVTPDEKNCLYCKSGVNTGVKCFTCKGLYHNSCAIRITGLKVLSGSRGIVQCPCLQSEVKQTQTSNSSLEMSTNTEADYVSADIYSQLLKSKDTIILELQENKILQNKTITLLEEKISWLQNININMNSNLCTDKNQNLNVNKTNTTINSSNVNNRALENNTLLKNVDETEKQKQDITKDMKTSGNKSYKTALQLSNQQDGSKSKAQQYEARQREIMNGIINLAPTPVTSVNSRVQEDFKLVTYKKKRNQTKFGSSETGCQITAVESRREVFISRLDPTTTKDQILNHLKGKNITPLNVEKLDIQSSGIAAYKITVALSESKTIQAPEVWPKFTIIRPYRKPRNFQKVALDGRVNS